MAAMTDNRLTWDKLLETWGMVKGPPLYYALVDLATKGEVIKIEKSWWHPEYIIIHPDDLERIKAELPFRTLTPLKAVYQDDQEITH